MNESLDQFHYQEHVKPVNHGCRFRSIQDSPRFLSGESAVFFRGSFSFFGSSALFFYPSRGSSAILRYPFSRTNQTNESLFNFVNWAKIPAEDPRFSVTLFSGCICTDLRADLPWKRLRILRKKIAENRKRSEIDSHGLLLKSESHFSIIVIHPRQSSLFSSLLEKISMLQKFLITFGWAGITGARVPNVAAQCCYMLHVLHALKKFAATCYMCYIHFKKSLLHATWAT